MKNYPHSTFFDFESLELYKKSLDYTDVVYDLVMLFPKEERFELGSQLNRAATSISLNIAEGYGESIPLAIRYLRIVRGSIRECLACSTIAFRRNYMDEQKYVESRTNLVELSKLAAGYKKYLNRKLNK
ncbi:four helix bundle protein [Maribellus sediminis]|uniref:four helix bundle protein n=1 Tax=Maribellus sediminis TaxID=2696285 RepID=UPI0014305D40|nr:four helix bundle protein [Maribellus sediminis]